MIREQRVTPSSEYGLFGLSAQLPRMYNYKPSGLLRSALAFCLFVLTVL